MAKTTQAERDRNEHRNIQVVNDFLKHWDTLGVDLRDSGVGLYFKAQVNYRSPKFKVVEQTFVRILLSGYGTDGNIEIIERGDLVVENFHLGMVPAFGTYTLDKATGELGFRNSSPKMGGAFTVQITPLKS